MFTLYTLRALLARETLVCQLMLIYYCIWVTEVHQATVGFDVGDLLMYCDTITLLYS